MKADSKSHPRAWPGHATQFAVAEGGKFDRALTGCSGTCSERVSTQHPSSVIMLISAFYIPRCVRTSILSEGGCEELRL